MKSGLPVSPERWPNFQPLIADRMRRDRNFHSVDRVPLDVLRLMIRERVILLNLSKARPSVTQCAASRTDMLNVYFVIGMISRRAAA